MPILQLPGYGNSDEAHWQSRWEHADPSIARFAPASWDAPELGDWCAALDRGVEGLAGSVVLLAHSLSCLLVAHWAARSVLTQRVAGAMLVAPPDPDGPAFPRAEASSFIRPEARPLPFPALVVASSDDPYATLDFARGYAKEQGAGFVCVGAKGHINSESGLGDWSEGANLFTAFRAGLGLRD